MQQGIAAMCMRISTQAVSHIMLRKLISVGLRLAVKGNARTENTRFSRTLRYFSLGLSYLNSEHGGMFCTRVSIRRFGNKQCAIGRIQGFVVTEIKDGEVTCCAYQPSFMSAGRAATMCSQGYHFSGADNRGSVQEPAQSSTSLHSAVGRTDVGGVRIPEYDSTFIMPGADIATRGLTLRSVSARAATGNRFRANGRITQMHSSGM